jgi:SNF2 family DNA or RNA helicase
MMEEQALDRVHRIGQKKGVTTVRFVVKDTFEEVSCLEVSCLDTLIK